MQRWLKRAVPLVFSVLMVVSGIVDLTRPQSLKQAMEALRMPHYMLSIVGGAKVVGGVTLLANRGRLSREWAYAGFFIWATGGLACHLFSGHGMGEMTPIAGLALLLAVSYWCDRRADAGTV